MHRPLALSSRALAPLVALLSVAVAVTGLQTPVEAQPVAAAATASAVDNSARPDPVSAMVTARAIGGRVEDLSQRDEYTRVYANPDGTWTGETASEPQQVQDDEGGWHDVDTTLVERDGDLVPAFADSDLVLSTGGGKTFASMTEDGKQLDWRWPTTLPAPVVDGDTATYPAAVPDGGDLVVTATSTGFTHNIVLTEPPAQPLEVTLPIITHGADLVEDPSTGSLSVQTAAGDTLVAAPQPVMWDSSTDAGGQPEVAPVDTAVGETAAGTPTLTLSPAEGFLADPDTVYPVTIDPSYSNSANTTGDTWVQNADYTSSQVSSDQLRAGTYDGGSHKARSFMHFDTTKWNGKHILSATLVMRNWYSGSCTGAAIRAARISEAWSAPDVTWANQPAAGSLYYDDFNPAYGYTSSCAGDDATWSIKDMVQDWADGSFTNNGIRLKAVDETSIYTWRKYRSANYGGSVVPHINYTYNSYPNKPGTPTVTTSPASSAGYSISTTPTLKATVSDPDGGSVRALFEIYQGTNLVWSGTTPSPGVSSGSSVSRSVPTGELSNGQTYTLKAKGYDGTDYSKTYSSVTTFTVDTSKPTATVTASAFTNGQWTTDVPASNTFTFNGPSDTKSFAYTLDGVTQSAKVADANGDATVSWLPKSGAHTLTVTPTDKAGNVGSTVTFTFGVGPASFTTPAPAARSTGVFPVEISGPPNATGAALSWRYAGKTTWNAASGMKTGAGSAWSGTVSNTGEGSASVSPALVWDATGELDPDSTANPKENIKAPALLELRVCFTYSGTPSQVCSTARQVQLVPSAFGGNFPVTAAGPAMVALFTGEVTLTEPDAVDALAGMGRTFASFDGSTSTPGAFGPGWSSSLFAVGDTTMNLVDHRDVDGTFVLVTAGGSSQMFTRDDIITNRVVYRPVANDDGSVLELTTGTDPDTGAATDLATLTRPQGPVTTWTKPANSPQAPWELASATSQEMTSGDPEVGVESSAPGYPTWIAQIGPISQNEPGASVMCTEADQEPGCRGLKLTYTGTGDAQRVSAIELVTAGASPVTVASYTYSSGRLTRVCGRDPDPADTEVGPLCADYDYDTTTVPGRTLLKTAAPPGQAAWHFNYDPTGRLATVTRALDQNTNTGTGPATWTIAYDLDAATTGLPDLSASAAAQWGQTTLPTKAAAVWSPDHIPAGTPTSSDLAYADLWYYTADGATTNTAVHGNVDGTSQWLVDTTWYDEHGNVTQNLDAAGRARALAADPVNQASTASAASTFTDYSTDGTRVENEYGSVHTATLKDGTTGPFRPHTEYIYDDQAPTLGGGSKPALPEGQGAFDMVVEERHSATGPDKVGEYDLSVVRYEYDPVVVGDGNGWELGTPTRTNVQLEDGSWSTTVARSDTEGRQIEARQPGGSAAVDGSGSDAHATVFSYYAAGAPDTDCDITGRPARAGWDGLLCKTGPAGQPTGPTMPVTYNADYNTDLHPTRIEETSGSSTRVTTTSYDAIGRTLTKTVTEGGDTRTSTIGYDATSGLPTTTSNADGSVSTAYDTWGRTRRYTDAFGMESTTTYTSDSQIATFHDGQGTYTYTYDGGSGEHRRVPTSVGIGVAGVSGNFVMTYDAAGAQSTVTYPNGMVATHEHDELGVPTGLDYADGSGQNLLSFSATVDVDGKVVGYTSDASEQDYAYDSLGRLTEVHDTRAGECSTRTYGFSAASERTAFASYDPDTNGGACQQNSATVSKVNTYDTANRIRNTGYTYDNLGRTLTTPAVDSAAGAAGPLGATYFANNMVKSLTQLVDDGLGGTITETASYGLDPTGRINNITHTRNGAEDSRLRYAFSGQSDAPSSIQTSVDAGESWITTRYVSVPGLGMVVSVTGTEVTYQISNLHGDVVATQAHGPSALTIDSYTEVDEYGNSTNPSGARYGWLGTSQRSSDTVGGTVLMGVRVYNPVTGAFSQPDAIRGGNPNAYVYPLDPVNSADTSGLYEYLYYYPMRWNPFLSSTNLFSRIRSNFNWVFTFPNNCAPLTIGSRCSLSGQPVQISWRTDHSFTFLSLPGHAEGAGKYIRFSVYRSYGLHKLRVHAWGPDVTWCDRHSSCAAGNRAAAFGLWAIFAQRINLLLSW